MFNCGIIVDMLCDCALKRIVRLCYIQIVRLKPLLLFCFSFSEMFNYGVVYMLYDYIKKKKYQNMIYSNISFMLPLAGDFVLCSLRF